MGKQVQLPVVCSGVQAPATKLNARAGGNWSFSSPSPRAQVDATLGLAMPWLGLLSAELSSGVAGKAAAPFPLAALFTVAGSGSTL